MFPVLETPPFEETMNGPNFKLKKGVDPTCVPELMAWAECICYEYKCRFGFTPYITSIFREGAGAHGRGEGFDLRRNVGIHVTEFENFCRNVQHKWGRWIGVQLEPEWGKGTQYTAPHIHFQLKKPAIWREK